MCTVIVLVLKNKNKVPVYVEILEGRGRELVIDDAFNDVRPPYGGLIKPPEVVVFPVKKKVKPKEFCCDCGTELGALFARQPEKSMPSAFEISKKRKLGWSETKIHRWLEEFEKSNARQERKYEEELSDLEQHLAEVEHQDPDGWVETFSALLSQSGDSYLKVFLDSSPEKADIAEALKKPMRRLHLASEKIKKDLWSMEMGVFYEVRR